MPLLNNDEEEELIQVGPGTPSGEVFRRYWLPCETSANLGSHRESSGRNPIRVKMLGEDLVLFRDAKGSPHLLAEHCSHRGTSLYYGRVEGDCLRCIYHGWLYNGDGTLAEVPSEPDESNFRLTVRHRAYPCFEVGGFIFTYMGPPDRQPIFPQYPVLFREDGVRVTGNAAYIEQCNVFQALHDNNLDPWHHEFAHGRFSDLDHKQRLHHSLPPFKAERTPWGTRYLAIMTTDEPDKYEYHEQHTVWPCQRGGSNSLKWSIPVDDYRTRWFVVSFQPLVNGKVPQRAMREQQNKHHIGWVDPNLPIDWAEQVGAWNNFGHQWRPSNIWEDEVCQATQGAVERHYLPDWEQWHLCSSDRGMVLNRQVWREQIERVKQGLDPIGVIRDPDFDGPIHIPMEIDRGLEWDEALRRYSRTMDEKLQEMASRGEPVPTWEWNRGSVTVVG